MKKPEITLIGAGNLAYHLGIALYNANYHIRQVYSRTQEHAEQLANRLNAAAISDLSLIDQSSDIYLFALKDNALAKIASLKLGGKIVAHTSGILPTGTLKSISKNCGILYPLQTFIKEKAVDFKEVVIIVNAGTPKAKKMLTELALSLSTHVENLDDKQREWLHIAAVFANNFTNYLFGISYELAEKHHIPFELLRPLIEQTVANILRGDPHDFQTGPAVRGDTDTILKHAEILLSGSPFRKLYLEFTKLITRDSLKKQQE